MEGLLSPVTYTHHFPCRSDRLSSSPLGSAYLKEHHPLPHALAAQSLPKGLQEAGADGAVHGLA